MLRGAQELAEQEQGTAAWFAFRENTTVFGVFETFEDEQGRQAHLTGRSPRHWARPRRRNSARRR
ncbi:hypothetical protein AB0D71_41855 [Streptomyces avermitilis]|uniref:hypothetical protein n=1 Tax=Streptomyces avermitilis TaxID=33903 RepID=UPI0033C7EEE5